MSKRRVLLKLALRKVNQLGVVYGLFGKVLKFELIYF